MKNDLFFCFMIYDFHLTCNFCTQIGLIRGMGQPMMVQGSPKGTDVTNDSEIFFFGLVFLTPHYEPLQNFVFVGYWLLSLY